MLPRISRYVLAVVVAVAAGVFRADVAHAPSISPPLQLTSLEWLVADSDVVLRGVVVGVASDQNWNIVTFDVLETLKGTEAKRLKFAVHTAGKGCGSCPGETVETRAVVDPQASGCGRCRRSTRPRKNFGTPQDRFACAVSAGTPRGPGAGGR